MNRRQFLLNSGLLTASLYGNLSLATQHVGVAAKHADFKALVCVFLHGGNDAFNMLIPADEERYAEYQVARGSVALELDTPGAAAIPLISANDTSSFAVHPACAPLATLYRDRKLAFVANVGKLVEPTSIKSVLNGTARLPSSLFSHNDQRNQWQSGLDNAQAATGWLGRAADVYYDSASSTSFSMNVSLSGSNLMQTGRWVMPYSISPNGPVNVRSAALLEALKETVSNSASDNILEQVFTDTQNYAYERNRFFSEMINAHELKTRFPDTSLGDSLKAIANTIAANKSLGQARQTFFVLHKGWDTHQEQSDRHSSLLAELAEGLSAFDNALQQLQLADKVTTFTASEFGRTLRSNGRGTDHGWGGISTVMGGAVNGGRVYGHYPEKLALGAGMDIGVNGRLLPSLSTEQMIAPLLRWYGLSASHLQDVLPSLTRFEAAAGGGVLAELLKI